MEVEVLSDRKNPLLKRREVKIKVSFQGMTPKRMDVRSKVVAVLNSDKELTVLDALEPEFGAQLAQGYVKVYDDKKAMSIEPKYKLYRNFPEMKEVDKAAAASKQAPKTEGGA
ncbi:MAG: 30S ribosomal protein S24e [Candidatus Altiarchaeota archaeon]